jgi:hypothetical protein
LRAIFVPEILNPAANTAQMARFVRNASYKEQAVETASKNMMNHYRRQAAQSGQCNPA